jgi:hypothetical protein
VDLSAQAQAGAVACVADVFKPPWPVQASHENSAFTFEITFALEIRCGPV